MTVHLPFLWRFLVRSDVCGSMQHSWCFGIPAVMGVGLVSPRILSDVKNHRRYGNYWLRTVKGVRAGKGWRSAKAYLHHAEHATMATKNRQSSHR